MANKKIENYIDLTISYKRNPKGWLKALFSLFWKDEVNLIIDREMACDFLKKISETFDFTIKTTSSSKIYKSRIDILNSRKDKKGGK